MFLLLKNNLTVSPETKFRNELFISLYFKESPLLRNNLNLYYKKNGKQNIMAE